MIAALVTRLRRKKQKTQITQAHILAFIQQCEWLYILHSHYRELYGAGQLRLNLLEYSAHSFFVDIQRVLHAQIVQQVCCLTDRPEMGLKGKNKNLTVEFILKNIELPEDQCKALQMSAKQLKKFRKQVLPARNKMISHFDRDTAITDISLGTFKRGQLEEFETNLQKFVNIIHGYYIGGIYSIDFNSQTDELIEALKKSTYFETLRDMDHIESECYAVSENSDYAGA